MSNNNLYNLILIGGHEFWSTDEGHVDLRKSRFLEHTTDEIKKQFQPLDQKAIAKIKKLPTLFATEREVSDTKIGKVTEVEDKGQDLIIHFKFEKDKNKPSLLCKGTLESPELCLNRFEKYRTHWAIKDANLIEFLERRENKIEGIFDKIKNDLDTPHSNPEKSNHIKVSTLYACNASGKTRLSKLFADQYDDKVLYYNAFTEDLFSWDNKDYVLKIDAKAGIFRTIQDQGLDKQIINNFKKFTGSKLEPTLDIPEGKIKFSINSGDESSSGNVKISRGEESVFVWSVFYTILDVAIGALNENPDNRTTNEFDKFQYIVIDDPVSSMDDTRIITVALELAELIKKSKNQLKFLITTHHALFFNVLFNFRFKNWDRKNYILSKSDTEFHLKTQGKDSPFAYHHVIISEIKEAIEKKDIRRYHFNLFRSLLEKTANFLGYETKDKCLDIMSDDKTQDGLNVFRKTLEHYSHNSLWDLEPKNVSELEQVAFEQSFNAFIEKFNWGMMKNG